MEKRTSEAEYGRYCARHRRNHPHVPPTRREYEYRHTRHQEARPSSRC
ncbi:hypothetical protein AB0J81_14130 [Streptomyces bobili]